MRRLLALLLVVGAVLGATMLLVPEWFSAPADPPYRLAKVDRGPIVATVNATGAINPTTTVIVGSQLSGQVVEVLADYNSKVAAGEVVARLNSDQIRARLDAARADLAQMRATRLVQEAQIKRVVADIARAKAATVDAQAQITRNDVLLADAERALTRQEELRRRGVTSEAALDTARTQRDAQRASLDSVRAALASAQAQEQGLEADRQVAEAQLQAVDAQILQREAAVRQIEVDLRNTEIRSPVSGTVVQRNVELGATVAASLQAPTLFLIADDLSRMEIAANIDETDVGRIREGQRVTFAVNAYPGRTFEGVVKQVRLGSQTVQNVVIYTTIISVDNPRQELLPGMTANLQIETDQRNDVLRVPNAALRWRPPAAGSEPAGRAPGPGPGPAMATEGPGGGRAAGAAPRGAQTLRDLSNAIRAELDLTQEQQKEVDAAFEEMRQSLRAGNHGGGRREAAQTARKQLVARITAVLNPEQRAKFNALRSRLAQGRGANTVQYGRVHVLSANGEPDMVAVRLGVSDGVMTEAAGEGLTEGREVIIGGGPRPAEGAGQSNQPRRGPRFGF